MLRFSEISEDLYQILPSADSKLGFSSSRYLPHTKFPNSNISGGRLCSFESVKRNEHDLILRFVDVMSVQEKLEVPSDRKRSPNIVRKSFFNDTIFFQSAVEVIDDDLASIQSNNSNFPLLSLCNFQKLCKMTRRSVGDKIRDKVCKSLVSKPSCDTEGSNCIEPILVPKFFTLDLEAPCEIRSINNVPNSGNTEFDSNKINNFALRINIQGGGSKYPRTCSKCHETYTVASSFSRHITEGKCKRTTNPEPVKDSNSFLICPQCSAGYASRISLRRHMKATCKNHKLKFVPCIEPGCGIQFHSQTSMMYHLVEAHGIDLKVQKIVFASMAEFAEWKRLEERRTFTQLTKRRSDYTIASGKRAQYFSCMFNVIERHTRKPATVKRSKGIIVNTNCPAKINLLEGPDGFEVTYYAYHNHELKEENLKFCRWNLDTKDFIINMIDKKVPVKTIREELIARGSVSDSPLPLKEHSITLKEISRMKYAEVQKMKMKKKEALSVQLLVNFLHAEKPDSILIYKPHSKPLEIGEAVSKYLSLSSLFILGIQEEKQRVEMNNSTNQFLCINTAQYSEMHGFNLVSIFIQDEFGKGYPTAHFLTNRVDSDTFKVLFSVFKAKNPSFIPSAFVTNDNSVLYDAFSEVFENKPVHLVCKLDLMNSWLNQLKQKVGNSELVSEIHSCLNSLVEEDNYENFLQMLSDFSTKYEGVCPDFLAHFSMHYAEKPEPWAMCFRNRPYAPTDSSVFIDAFCEKFKMLYKIEGGRKRVDDFIKMLLKVNEHFHLALLYNRLTQETAGENELSRHSKGMLLLDENITKTKNVKFKFKSETKDDTYYIVSVLSSKCPVPNVCYIQCHEAPCYSLCCHMYSCTCSDINELCKHIHKVNALNKSKVPLDIADKSSQANSAESSQDISARSSQKNAVNSNSDNRSPSSISEKILTLLESAGDENPLSASQETIIALQSLLTEPKTQPLHHYVTETLKSLVSECNTLLGRKNTPKKFVKMPKKPLVIPKKPLENSKKPSETPCSSSIPTDHTYIDSIKKTKIQATNSPKTTIIMKQEAKPPPPKKKEVDHTYIDLTKKTKIQTTNSPKTAIIMKQEAKPPPPKKKKVVRIPLSSLNQSSQLCNFTGTLKPTDSVTESLHKFGHYDIRLFHLKSLDLDIPATDLARIQSEVPDFKKGWLYDCIIFLYLTQISQPFPSVKVIDPCVSQILSDSKRKVVVISPVIEYERLFIPCNPNNNHWLLLVAYPKQKIVHFFDPQYNTLETRYRQFIFSWVKVLAQNIGSLASEWKICVVKHICQADNLNCGVFISWYADQILKNESPNVTLSVDTYRHQMYKVLKNSLKESAT